MKDALKWLDDAAPWLKPVAILVTVVALTMGPIPRIGFEKLLGDTSKFG
ncbi:MAG: hypothetical protein GY851_18305, partial [bacterium]|nr:hypothetical protein [bacterium]